MVNPETPPFPHRLAKKKKILDDQEVLETLKKLKGNERVCMGETVSAVLQKTNAHQAEGSKYVYYTL